MAEIGLRPTSDGQPLHFELNIHGQQKVFRFQVHKIYAHVHVLCVLPPSLMHGAMYAYKAYILTCTHTHMHTHTLSHSLPPSHEQAQTKEVREMWASEIRRLLEAQFTLMKGYPVGIHATHLYLMQI